MRGENERVRLPQLEFLVRQVSLISHQTQHRVAPPDGALGVGARIVDRRRLGKRRQRGRFRDVQLRRVFAEVDLRGGLHTVGAGAEVDLVQVQLQDRVFGEVALDLDGDARFLQLTRELLLAADLVREDVAGELHADRREALRIAEREQVRLKGAEHPQIIYAVVRVETLVLGGEERLPHGDRNLGKRQDRATFQAEL